MITVSVLTFVALEHSKRCIQALLERSTLPYELILTANGNPTAAEYFKSVADQHAHVRVVVNETNLGFQIPNTHALSLTTTEYFVMLNDDTIVPPRWLESLVEPFTKNPKAALTAPRGTCCALNEKFHGYVGGRVEYLEASCLMGKTEILKKHGLFSPHLKFAYGEDSDLSLRMQEAGYTIHQANFKLITHIRAATSSKVPGILKIQEENHVYLRKRWGHYLRTRRFDYPIIVQRMGAHGDVLLLTPVLRALHEQRPHNPIFVRTSVPDVLHGNPNIVRASAGINNPMGAMQINLDGTYEAKPDRHIIEIYAGVVGVDVPRPYKLEIFPGPGDRAWATTKIPDDKWIAIHPGPSTWKGKEWPKDRFEFVAKTLREQGWRVVLVGSADIGIANDLDLRGKTSIMQMAAVIARTKLFIGLDSLPMHLSQAVGTPTIGLFGITDPQWISTDGSWFHGVKGTGTTAGMRHRTVGKTHVNDNGVAMNTIAVEEVIRVAQEKLCAPVPTT